MQRRAEFFRCGGCGQLRSDIGKGLIPTPSGMGRRAVCSICFDAARQVKAAAAPTAGKVATEGKPGKATLPACPRCGGQVMPDNDPAWAGRRWHCQQCGLDNFRRQAVPIDGREAIPNNYDNNDYLDRALAKARQELAAQGG